MPLMLLACSHEETELPLYQRYADSKDLTVAQVKGFQIGDTLKTDVVLLVADDSAAWAELKAEFDIRTSEGVTSWMGDIDEPARRVKRAVRPAWRAMAVHADRTVAFYRVDTEAQHQALLDYQLDNLNQNHKKAQSDLKRL
jgi:hypothetical protein